MAMNFKRLFGGVAAAVFLQEYLDGKLAPLQLA